jgi:esterase/lipase superfamily enzyme
LSGSFAISSFFDGYHDDNIYFNSPYEYVPNMPDPWKGNHMHIIIGTGEWDNTRDESYWMSGILNCKGIKHWLDDGKWRGHDWNYWRDMLPYICRCYDYLASSSRAKPRDAVALLFGCSAGFLDYASLRSE